MNWMTFVFRYYICMHAPSVVMKSWCRKVISGTQRESIAAGRKERPCNEVSDDVPFGACNFLKRSRWEEVARGAAPPWCDEHVPSHHRSFKWCLRDVTRVLVWGDGTPLFS